jgi:hypothetical protein
LADAVDGSFWKHDAIVATAESLVRLGLLKFGERKAA